MCVVFVVVLQNNLTLSYISFVLIFLVLRANKCLSDKCHRGLCKLKCGSSKPDCSAPLEDEDYYITVVEDHSANADGVEGNFVKMKDGSHDHRVTSVADRSGHNGLIWQVNSDVNNSNELWLYNNDRQKYSVGQSDGDIRGRTINGVGDEDNFNLQFTQPNNNQCYEFTVKHTNQNDYWKSTTNNNKVDGVSSSSNASVFRFTKLHPSSGDQCSYLNADTHFCSSQNHCEDGNWCDTTASQMKCKKKKDNGQSCSDYKQCKSNRCIRATCG